MTSLAISDGTRDGLLTRVGGAFFNPRHRPLRVVCLLASVVVMSFTDLALTLNYATTVGMMEMNPLARAVMNTGSPASLTLWKACTAGLGVLVLFLLRRHPRGEVGSWVCFAIMAMLCVHWARFNAGIQDCIPEYASLIGTDHPSWVMMTAN
ncbi:MAG: hypothetical protein KF864_06890 [Phycisphaeraceae bacterium]|nr:hypothetical protein [Phycisphaeraceae bacterium]